MGGAKANFHYEVYAGGSSRPIRHGILYGPYQYEWRDGDEMSYSSWTFSLFMRFGNLPVRVVATLIPFFSMLYASWTIVPKSGGSSAVGFEVVVIEKYSLLAGIAFLYVLLLFWLPFVLTAVKKQVIG